MATHSSLDILKLTPSFHVGFVQLEQPCSITLWVLSRIFHTGSTSPRLLNHVWWVGLRRKNHLIVSFIEPNWDCYTCCLPLDLLMVRRTIPMLLNLARRFLLNFRYSLPNWGLGGTCKWQLQWNTTLLKSRSSLQSWLYNDNLCTMYRFQGSST